MVEYVRVLGAAEVSAELGISLTAAKVFLKEHGFKACRVWVIGQRELRLMQLDGTLAEWQKRHNGRRGRPAKSEE